MLYLAVKVFSVLAPLGQQQAALEDPVWAKVKPNILVIEVAGRSSGLGVLIDSNGHFLTHRTAILSETITGRLNETQPLALTLVSVDEQTQMALLKARNWANGQRRGIGVASKTVPGSPLVAATLGGPVRGEFVSDNKVGQMRPSLRYAPLTEIRLESNAGKVGGAIVFDQSGSLVGLLGATLSVQMTAKPRVESATGLDFAPKTVQKADQVYGPQGMTVAYSLGSSVLKRVVQGFLSEDHKVKHPSIGLFFKEAAQPGALVEVVMDGSPSASAGLKPGDLVTAVDDQDVRSPIDLAVILFECEIGQLLKVKYLRSGEERTTSLRVGDQPLQT